MNRQADCRKPAPGTFKARANIFVSSEQLQRLSEKPMYVLSDLHLNGGLAAYFDTKPRIEADVKLKDINFDYFSRHSTGKSKGSSGKQDFFLKFDSGLGHKFQLAAKTANRHRFPGQHR